MGLFSFLKKAGAKIFDRKGNEPVETVAADVAAEEARVEASEAAAKVEALRNQKIVLLRSIVSDLCLDGGHDVEVDLNGDKVTVYGSVDAQADKEKIVLALGNVAGIATVDDRMRVSNPEPEAQFYTVRKGDSLSKIAKTVYGDPMKYNAIFEANKPMLSHPDKIYPGQTLRIPAV